MKKIAAIVIVLIVLLFSVNTAAFGASGPKEISVTLSDSPTVMKVGETIELTAMADKHGSSWTDSWENAVETSSVFVPETEAYLSKAVFTAEKPGTYVIRYTIRMTAGNSNTVFLGTIERTMEVTAPAPTTVVGAQIRDLTVQPLYNTNGYIAGYRASGKVYTQWSDNSATLYGAIFFNFGASESSKDVRVTMNINGSTYIYMVTVSR